MTPKENLRALYLLLKLRDDTADTDRAIVDALSSLTWFDHVILVVPSWQDKPDAANHPLVRRAIDTCKVRGIRVIWGRWLWQAWPIADVSPRHLDPIHYACAIARIKAEAALLGADGTHLDMEPYAGASEKDHLRTPLTLEQQVQIRAAAMTAVEAAGPVDYIRPTSSNSPLHFCWSLLELGEHLCDSKTYYVKAPDYEVPKVSPPPWCKHLIDIWGCNVGLGRPEDVVAGQLKLTADDVKTLDLSAIRWMFPECKGIWVYADYDILAKVIRSWS